MSHAQDEQASEQGTLDDIDGADLPEREFPPHLESVDDPNHHAKCSKCQKVITVGTHEYGHQKDPPRCPHRPSAVDPYNPGGPNDDQ